MPHRQLLTNPRIVMLDEPTSGLDSTSAVALIGILQSIALEGRTVVTAIHQPNSAVFASFDRLILLVEGRVVYSGSPGGTLDYFSRMGFPCPAGYNAADHCMDLLVGGPVPADAPSSAGTLSAGAGEASRPEGEASWLEGGATGGATRPMPRARLVEAWDSLDLAPCGEEWDKLGWSAQQVRQRCRLRRQQHAADRIPGQP